MKFIVACALLLAPVANAVEFVFQINAGFENNVAIECDEKSQMMISEMMRSHLQIDVIASRTYDDIIPELILSYEKFGSDDMLIDHIGDLFQLPTNEEVLDHLTTQDELLDLLYDATVPAIDKTLNGRKLEMLRARLAEEEAKQNESKRLRGRQEEVVETDGSSDGWIPVGGNSVDDGWRPVGRHLLADQGHRRLPFCDGWNRGNCPHSHFCWRYCGFGRRRRRLDDRSMATGVPSETPSATPSGSPSATPSATPSTSPSASPSAAPSSAPHTPSMEPSMAPSETPSFSPSVLPSASPSAAPSSAPHTPSMVPSMAPSETPSSAPSLSPSEGPSAEPSSAPHTPSMVPSMAPSVSPSVSPSSSPSSGHPSEAPSASPSDVPSVSPSKGPTGSPSEAPSPPPTTASPTVTPEHIKCKAAVAAMESRVSKFITEKLRFMARQEICPCLGKYWDLQVIFETDLEDYCGDGTEDTDTQ